MNILFIKHFFVGFMVSEIPRVSVFGHCPYSVTFPYITGKLGESGPNLDLGGVNLDLSDKYLTSLNLDHYIAV